MTDAASGCPSPGKTLQLANALFQVLPSPCTDYTESPQRAIAMVACPSGQFNPNLLMQSVGGAPLVAATLAPVSPYYIGAPKLFPEGDRVVVTQSDSGGSETLSIFVRAADDSWSWSTDLPIPLVNRNTGMETTIGAITRGPPYHFMLRDPTTGTLEEYVGDGATWSSVATYQGSDLVPNPTNVPVEFFSVASLGIDGLRMIFSAAIGSQGMTWYTDRVSLNDRFRIADAIDAELQLPGFLSADCSRVYGTGLGSVLYQTSQ